MSKAIKWGTKVANTSRERAAVEEAIKHLASYCELNRVVIKGKRFRLIRHGRNTLSFEGLGGAQYLCFFGKGSQYYLVRAGRAEAFTMTDVEEVLRSEEW